MAFLAVFFLGLVIFVLVLAAGIEIVMSWRTARRHYRAIYIFVIVVFSLNACLEYLDGEHYRALWFAAIVSLSVFLLVWQWKEPRPVIRLNRMKLLHRR